MALSLKDPETDRLAREVASMTGETLAVAIRTSLAERLHRERLHRERLRRGQTAGLAEQLAALRRECATLPDYDTRAADDIIGYDETGMWR